MADILRRMPVPSDQEAEPEPGVGRDGRALTRSLGLWQFAVVSVLVLRHRRSALA